MFASKKIKVSRFMAKQYANPSGWFGRIFTATLLNRANQQANLAVYAALGLQAQHRLLEVGFGGAELLFHIARHSACTQIFGVEISQAMLQRAQNMIRRDTVLSGIQLATGGISALPYENACFDRVCSINTVYFWPDLLQGCRELARVTANDGLVILGFGSGEKLAERGYSENGFHFYQPGNIHQAMSQAGLSLVQAQRMERKHKDPFFICIYGKSRGSGASVLAPPSCSSR